MSEYQTFLGSAASVDAVALGGADGHSLGKAKRRASSERRAAAKPVQGADRSRSPERETQTDVRAEVAERAMLAPLYVEPGGDGDTMGIEGRHRNNMAKLFGFVDHAAKILNNHADILDNHDCEHRVFKRFIRDQSLEIKAMKNSLIKSDEETKRIVEANDAMLKDEHCDVSPGHLGLLVAE